MDKKVLMVSAGLVHPSIPARRRFDAIVREVARVVTVTTHRIEDLVTLSSGDYDGAVLYFHRRHISPGALSALARFVSSGGGLLAVHGASASFKEKPRYFDILGGRFVSHGKVGPYAVTRTGNADPAFRVAESFWVRDELYIHEYRDDVVIHYTADAPHGPEPVVWTRRHGEGRVCYVSMGHMASVMENPAVRRIIADGLLWTLGIGGRDHHE